MSRPSGPDRAVLADERLRRHLCAKEVAQRNSFVRVCFFCTSAGGMGVVSVGSFWYASVCGFVFVVGSVRTYLLFILFLCTIRRHERPWNYWYFVLVLFHLLQRRHLLVHRYIIGAPLVRTRWCDPPLSVIRCLVHCPLLDRRHQVLDVEVGPRRRVVLVSQEFLDLCTRRDASLDGRANGLFSCRRGSLNYRGQVDAWGRPHGEGSWADEFFYGECLQGTWVEESAAANFQSRERQDECGIQSVASGSSLDPMFYGISAVHGRVAAPLTPGIFKNFLATPAHGLGGPAEDPRSAVTHFGMFRPSELRGEGRLRLQWVCSRVGCIPWSSMHYLDAPEYADAH